MIVMDGNSPDKEQCYESFCLYSCNIAYASYQGVYESLKCCSLSLI